MNSKDRAEIRELEKRLERSNVFKELEDIRESLERGDMTIHDHGPFGALAMVKERMKEIEKGKGVAKKSTTFGDLKNLNEKKYWATISFIYDAYNEIGL